MAEPVKPGTRAAPTANGADATRNAERRTD
ncbi:Uncharacterised protein [Mycobacterium tuberculosis]|uniref:Uncharacterized protein n=1 Tax=Mycobacterium tuberculosis TaxID=1773 RepID=A0A916LH48_MYCTX|nr:Uncharacterised protein [Mycobacterium tuberculosis]